jgi:hypothetical protein
MLDRRKPTALRLRREMKTKTLMSTGNFNSSGNRDQKFKARLGKVPTEQEDPIVDESRAFGLDDQSHVVLADTSICYVSSSDSRRLFHQTRHESDVKVVLGRVLNLNRDVLLLIIFQAVVTLQPQRVTSYPLPAEVPLLLLEVQRVT